MDSQSAVSVLELAVDALRQSQKFLNEGETQASQTLTESVIDALDALVKQHYEDVIRSDRFNPDNSDPRLDN